MRNITTFGVFLMVDAEWQARVKGLLKAELKRRNLSYRDLAEKLAGLGVHETERNLANKISRGGFTAVFLVQCLIAIGCRSVDLRVE
jgi:hypothetical protein